MVGCSSSSKQSVVPTGWLRVDAAAFSINAPPGWELRRQQGIDSYVGEFVGNGVALKFDFGRYSNRLDDEKEPTYRVSHEMVGGFSAKTVSPRTPGSGLTGIYFPEVTTSNKLVSNSLCLYGTDLTDTQQELALTIFRTIQFR
jgi:hypothetical protein